jgi:hypothetical protein
MKAEDELQMLKNIPPLSKNERRAKLRIALLLTASTLVSLLLLVYAFMQKKEADLQRENAIKAEMLAKQNMMEADRQRALAIAMEEEAMKQKLLARQALANCEKLKK